MKEHNLRQEQAIETRQKLLVSAKKLFANNGYSATPVRSVSKTINVSDGLLYHYFPNGKKEMLSCLVKEGLIEHMKNIYNYNEEIETLPLKDVLTKLYLNTDSFLTGDIDIIKILFRESEIIEIEETDLISQILHERVKWFIEFLKRRHLKGEIKDMDFEMAAKQFIAMSINNMLGKIIKIDFFKEFSDSTEIDRVIKQILLSWEANL